MSHFEKLWVICCETQSKLEIFSLIILRQTKPTHDRNALESEVIER